MVYYTKHPGYHKINFCSFVQQKDSVKTPLGQALDVPHISNFYTASRFPGCWPHHAPKKKHFTHWTFLKQMYK